MTRAQVADLELEEIATMEAQRRRDEKTIDHRFAILVQLMGLKSAYVGTFFPSLATQQAPALDDGNQRLY